MRGTEEDIETGGSKMEFEFAELENEVMDWLGLNPNLFTIKIMFDNNIRT